MPHGRRTFLLQKLLPFVLVVVVLQALWQLSHNGQLEYWVVHQATVCPAVWLINLITPQIQAQAQGFTIHAAGGGLNILNGCEGVEAYILLLAAFAVAPMSWRLKLSGSLLGLAFVCAVNQTRILLLFYAYRADPTWFDPLHSMVTPVAVVLLVCCYFYGFLYLSRSND